MTRFILALALASGVALAAAADPAPVEPAPGPAIHDPEPWSHTRFGLTIGLEAGLGAFTGDSNEPGELTDLRLDGLVHFRHFALGITAETGSVNLTTYDWSAAVTGGPAWNLGRGRLLVLAELGAHFIGAIGQTLFNGGALADTTAFIPQAGVNARYIWVGAASGSVSFIAMFEVFARFDLLRDRVTYQAQPCTSDEGCNLVTTTSVAGGTAAGAGASIGALF